MFNYYMFWLVNFIFEQILAKLMWIVLIYKFLMCFLSKIVPNVFIYQV